MMMFSLRYHARDASAILYEQELQDQYEYLDTRQCRPCRRDGRKQQENPRFMWGNTQEEDMNDVPCCGQEEYEDYIEEEENSETIQFGLR